MEVKKSHTFEVVRHVQRVRNRLIHSQLQRQINNILVAYLLMSQVLLQPPDLQVMSQGFCRAAG